MPRTCIFRHSFDAVLSTFGVMFTRTRMRASELLRVCKPKGQIGLANWSRMASSGRCSRRSANICRRQRGQNRRRCGAPRAARRDVRGRPSAIKVEPRHFNFRYARPTFSRCVQDLLRPV